MDCVLEGINFRADIKPNKLKIWTYTWYFFRSLWLRGPLHTFDLLWKERMYEKKFGIETTKIKLIDSNQYHHYQGASYKILLELFAFLKDQTKDFGFLDIGCGKGRAVLVAEYFGYSRLVGIDLDQELINCAYENLKKDRFLKQSSQVSFICENALNFRYNNEPCVYFLFNPFNEAVLQGVLQRILSQNTSEVWFIYMNPIFPTPFFSGGLELVKELKSWRYREALIFRRAAVEK